MSMSQQIAALQAMMAQSQQAPHVEFRAGILTQSGTTVTADERRGKVAVVTDRDGLLHLKWSLRPSGTVEKDLAIMSRTATWEKVPECTDGRVFLLRFKNSTAKHFFWMQEPKDEKDDETLKKLNELINNPPTMGMGQQLMQGAGAGGTSAASSGGGGAGGAGGMDQAALAAAAQSFAAQFAQQQQVNAYSVPDIVEGERVVPILDADEELTASLLEHLPESQRTPAGLRATLRSPQLQQTAARLGSVLNSEQFATVMASFGLPLSPSGDMGVRAFLDSVQRQADEKKEEEKPKE